MKRPKAIEFVEMPIPNIATRRVNVHLAHWDSSSVTIKTLLLGVYLQGLWDGIIYKEKSLIKEKEDKA